MCIRDSNVDTLAGMRLVGVRGVVVHEPEEMNQALEKACADPEIGLVPVSYTHLDVYKRQALDAAAVAPFLRMLCARCTQLDPQAPWTAAVPVKTGECLLPGLSLIHISAP